MALRFKLRDYQSEAVSFLVARQRAMVVAPAGSGKTIIGANAVARVVRSGQKVTWLAPTRETVAQAGEAISRTEGPENVEFEIVCAASNPDTSSSDIIVLDECHHLPSVSYFQTVVNATKQKIFGLTATPEHSDQERNAVLNLVFPDVFRIDRARVIASGHLVEGKVYMLDLDRPGQFDAEIDELVKIEVARRCRQFWSIPKFEHERRARHQITQQKLQSNEARNSSIVQTAIEEAENESVLILIQSIEHGELLASRIPGALLAHSKLAKKKRTSTIDGFRDGSLKVMIGSTLCDEGIDFPRASVLILAAGGRSAGKLEQRAGRVLRPFKGKSQGKIFDFVDRGAVFAHAQAKARIKTYQILGYEPEIVGGN